MPSVIIDIIITLGAIETLVVFIFVSSGSSLLPLALLKYNWCLLNVDLYLHRLGLILSPRNPFSIDAFRSFTKQSPYSLPVTSQHTN